jgi:hypothetical protein
MDRREDRTGAAARCAVAALAVFAVACGASPSSGPGTESTSAVAEGEGDPAAVQAAEATVRAFFAVKGRAEDPLSVRIDEQVAYLTSREVHPATGYRSSTSKHPSGLTDTELSVELSNTRMVGDEVLVDFAFESTGVTYPMIDYVMQRDDVMPTEGYWDGTATLEERDGEWLINDLTVVRSGSTFG